MCVYEPAKAFNGHEQLASALQRAPPPAANSRRKPLTRSSAVMLLHWLCQSMCRQRRGASRSGGMVGTQRAHACLVSACMHAMRSLRAQFAAVRTACSRCSSSTCSRQESRGTACTALACGHACMCAVCMHVCSGSRRTACSATRRCRKAALSSCAHNQQPSAVASSCHRRHAGAARSGRRALPVCVLGASTALQTCRPHASQTNVQLRGDRS